jgi:tRNA pseudouridine38-40 synthase
MPNLKITLEYDGARYCGWQVQNRDKSKPSIQGTIEKALRKILREKIRVIGSGRTDAGVHALAQVANFYTNSKIPLAKLQYGLNSNLPEDIVVTAIERVRQDFHSQFSARSKVYRYTVLNRAYPSPLLRHMVYAVSYPLDLGLMRREAKGLLGEHDFASFCASGSGARKTIRTIKYIAIKGFKLQASGFRPVACSLQPVAREFPLITIDIEADGFLYNMVRNIVGTLVEIGRGRFPRGSMRKVLAAKNRRFAGPTAPACGLALVKVRY